MKACQKHQQHLALLAADVLDERARRALQAHLADCPGCRDYLRAVSAICREHSVAAENAPHVEASDNFHRRLVQQIEVGDPVAARGSRWMMIEWLAAWRWRIALSIGLALLIVFMNFPRPRMEVASPPPTLAVLPVVKVAKADSPATWLAYRRAAGESPEALDALLTRDAAQSGGPSVRVTAFTRDLSALAD